MSTSPGAIERTALASLNSCSGSGGLGCGRSLQITFVRCQRIARVSISIGQPSTTGCLLKINRVRLDLSPFAGADFWHRCRRATPDDPLRSSNFPACSPGPAGGLTYDTANFSDSSSSSTSHSAGNSSPSATGLALYGLPAGFAVSAPNK